MTRVGVLAIDGGFETRVHLLQGLIHRHLAVTETHGSHVVDMRGEVALQFRPHPTVRPAIMNLLDSQGVPVQRTSSIQIAGVQSVFNRQFRFRDHFQIGHGFQMTTGEGSTTVLHGVIMKDIGLSGGARGRAREGVICGGSCDIRSSLFWPRIGDGIGGGNGTYIENIVMHWHFRGVKIRGTGMVLDSCFITGIGDTSVNCPAIWLLGCNAQVKGNAASGGATGMSFTGQYCSHVDDIANNTFHSMGIGVQVKGDVQSRPEQQRGLLGHGITLWQISDIGIWLYTKSSNSIVSNVVIVDSTIGIVWSNVGPDPSGGGSLGDPPPPSSSNPRGGSPSHRNLVRGDPLGQQDVSIVNSVFIGRSHNNGARVSYSRLTRWLLCSTLVAVLNSSCVRALVWHSAMWCYNRNHAPHLLNDRPVHLSRGLRRSRRKAQARNLGRRSWNRFEPYTSGADACRGQYLPSVPS